ncbi:MAG: hypothetical protein HRU26_11140 [Psychroserpens sp.]|nr:hypothetical protein [Psychroserpens sp.]
MHVWCDKRWRLINQPQDERFSDPFSTVFQEEYNQVFDILNASDLEELSLMLSLPKIAGVSQKTDDTKLTPNKKDSPENENLESKNTELSNVTPPIKTQKRIDPTAMTSLVLKAAFRIGKKLRPADFFTDMLEFYREDAGKYVDPEYIPSGDVGNKVCQEAVRAIAYDLFMDQLSCLKNPSNELRHRSKTLTLPDPFTIKVDGYSRGVKSFLPIIIKRFLPTSPITKHCLWRLPRTYGVYVDEYGHEFQRNSTGPGMFFSLVHTLTTNAFPDAHNRLPQKLGLTNFIQNCVEVDVDNGGGMIKGAHSFVNNIRKLCPDLPDPWDTTHQLATLWKKIASESKLMKRTLEKVNSIINFIRSPKRYSVFEKWCEENNFDCVSFSTPAPQRWAPSTRESMNQFIRGSVTLRCSLQIISSSSDFKGEPGVQAMATGYHKNMQTHSFLLATCLWIDLLNIESWATKVQERSNTNLETQHRLLVELPKKIDVLINNSARKITQSYRNCLRQEESVCGDLIWIYKFERDGEILDEFDVRSYDRGKAFMRESYPTFLDFAKKTIEEHMPVPAELSAWTTIFAPKTYDAKKIMKNRNYFTDAGDVIAKCFEGSKRFPHGFWPASKHNYSHTARFY